MFFRHKTWFLLLRFFCLFIPFFHFIFFVCVSVNHIYFSLSIPPLILFLSQRLLLFLSHRLFIFLSLSFSSISLSLHQKWFRFHIRSYTHFQCFIRIFPLRRRAVKTLKVFQISNFAQKTIFNYCDQTRPTLQSHVEKHKCYSFFFPLSLLSLFYILPTLTFHW